MNCKTILFLGVGVLSLAACSKHESPKVESYGQETVSKDINGNVTTKTMTDMNGKTHTTESHSVDPTH